MFIVKLEYSSGNYPVLDEVIKTKVSNKHRDGSGIGFGVRDLSYSFRTSKAAVNAFLALKSIRTLTKLSLEKTTD